LYLPVGGEVDPFVRLDPLDEHLGHVEEVGGGGAALGDVEAGGARVSGAVAGRKADQRRVELPQDVGQGQHAPPGTVATCKTRNAKLFCSFCN